MTSPRPFTTFAPIRAVQENTTLPGGLVRIGVGVTSPGVMVESTPFLLIKGWIYILYNAK